MTNHRATKAYRERVYGTYISGRQRNEKAYSEPNYIKWAKSAEIRFADWLSLDRNVPVLDLGCGHGNGLYLLQKLGYSNLTGVDLGEEQLALAAQLVPTAILVKDDIMNYLTKCTEKFALILCLNIIEHFDKDELFHFLDLLMKSLEPGGRVVFETPNAESPWFGAVAYADITHEWFFTPQGLADVLTANGFENFEARASEPNKYSITSTARSVLWKGTEHLLRLWNVIETGSSGSCIYTRVFVATAVKPVVSSKCA